MLSRSDASLPRLEREISYFGCGLAQNYRHEERLLHTNYSASSSLGLEASSYSTGEPGTRTSSTGVVELRSTCSATLP